MVAGENFQKFFRRKNTDSQPQNRNWEGCKSAPESWETANHLMVAEFARIQTSSSARRLNSCEFSYRRVYLPRDLRKRLSHGRRTNQTDSHTRLSSRPSTSGSDKPTRNRHVIVADIYALSPGNSSPRARCQL